MRDFTVEPLTVEESDEAQAVAYVSTEVARDELGVNARWYMWIVVHGFRGGNQVLVMPFGKRTVVH